MTRISAGPPPGPESAGIATRLGRLVADEPPFAVPLSPALDAAIRGGRRRRIRTAAAQVATALCVVALVTVVAVYARGGDPAQRAPVGGAPATGTATDAAAPERVQVGIYSGRPDPEWTLTPDERTRLADVLATLPSSTGEPPQGGLGYHGFVIISSDGTETVAYNGAVAPVGSGRREYRADPTRSVERLLARLAADHLTPDERAVVAAALG